VNLPDKRRRSADCGTEISCTARGESTYLCLLQRSTYLCLLQRRPSRGSSSGRSRTELTSRFRSSEWESPGFLHLPSPDSDGLLLARGARVGSQTVASPRFVISPRWSCAQISRSSAGHPAPTPAGVADGDEATEFDLESTQEAAIFYPIGHQIAHPGVSLATVVVGPSDPPRPAKSASQCTRSARSEAPYSLVMKAPRYFR
jgi:hypothetical protein